MKSYAIALGSNLGDRVSHLNQALTRLKELGRIRKLAPLFENPPWLPANAPKAWYSFFLNTALILESELEPLALLDATQKIEIDLGRPPDHPNWSPRTIDIDLLFDLSGNEFKNPRLTLPHPSWAQRNFVLAPLSHILDEYDMKDILQLYRAQASQLPALMGIINVTPDSFSESKDTKKIDYPSIFGQIKDHFENGVAYIDIGAESTRPGARPLTAAQEWQRLEPVLQLVRVFKAAMPFTQVSLDTYHPETAERGLDYAVDILNDVGGLKNPLMREIAPRYQSTIIMHSLSVPANKNVTWPEDMDPVAAMSQWLDSKLDSLHFLKPEQIIWDPGFGFGKTPQQSMALIENFQVFKNTPARSLVGHSRKSFMNLVTDKKFADRDPETLAISRVLAAKGADILRVHNVAAHREAFKMDALQKRASDG